MLVCDQFQPFRMLVSFQFRPLYDESGVFVCTALFTIRRWARLGGLVQPRGYTKTLSQLFSRAQNNKC